MSKKKNIARFCGQMFRFHFVSKLSFRFSAVCFAKRFSRLLEISERSEQFSVNSRAVNMNPVLGNPSNR